MVQNCSSGDVDQMSVASVKSEEVSQYRMMTEETGCLFRGGAGHEDHAAQELLMTVGDW